MYITLLLGVFKVNKKKFKSYRHFQKRFVADFEYSSGKCPNLCVFFDNLLVVKRLLFVVLVLFGSSKWLLFSLQTIPPFYVSTYLTYLSLPT